jgi:hypothetical protein
MALLRASSHDSDSTLFGLSETRSRMHAPRLLPTGQQDEGIVTERELLNAFRASDRAPQGKWWAEFPLGLAMGEDNPRKVDGLCITSRPTDERLSRSESPDWFREQRDSGWLDSEEVTLLR